VQADTTKDLEIHNANIPCRAHNVDILKSKHVFDMLVIGGGCVRACVCACVCVCVCVCAEFYIYFWLYLCVLLIQ